MRLMGTYPHPLHSRHSSKRPKGPESPHCFEGLYASCPNQGCYEVYERDLKWIHFWNFYSWDRNEGKAAKLRAQHNTYYLQIHCRELKIHFTKQGFHTKWCQVLWLNIQLKEIQTHGFLLKYKLNQISDIIHNTTKGLEMLYNTSNKKTLAFTKICQCCICNYKWMLAYMHLFDYKQIYVIMMKWPLVVYIIIDPPRSY